MDTQELIELIRRHDRTIGVAGPECPGEGELICFLYGRDDKESREAFRAHLDGCSYCTARLGVVAQAQRLDEPEAIEHELLARAIRIGHPESKKSIRQPRWWAAAAAAAMIVALGPIFMADREADSVSTPAATESSARGLRNIDTGELRTSITAPADGAEVPMDSLQVQWTGLAGSLYYDLRLVDAQGYVIWEGRVNTNEYTLPLGELELEAGKRYFLRVDAYLAEAKSVGSSHVGFIVRAPVP